MLPREHQEVCRLFAGILDYPGESLVEISAECARRLKDSFSGDAEDMQSFVDFASGQTRATLEEHYIQTFDMTTATTLYLGYHLFGETQKRNAFLVKLEEGYEADGFSSGSELPDHLCVMLRFISIARDPEFCRPLIDECILPTLGRIEETLKKDKNVYRDVISALKVFLQQVSRKMVRVGGLRA
ncbi:MAG: nitrate reductase molybdenum cofactor assembly chaperone [Chloroflexi bacterium]|nr:nitrate reductase molybdenum cofactor assembly chaperone [Chloroflexota bacterium]